MRIAFLSTDPSNAYRGTRGAAVRVVSLAEALVRAGHEVLLIAAAAEPGPPPPAGLTVELLPGPTSASVAARLAAEPGREAWLTKRLRQFGPDALYECLALHSSIGSAAARRLDVPHLVDMGAPLVEAARASRRLYHPDDAQRMEREVLAGAAAVFVATSPLGAYATEHGAPRVHVLPNAADPDRYPARTGVRDAPVAVFIASMGVWHGVETIVEAWLQLGDAAPRLIAIGDGPGRARLSAAGFEVMGNVRHDELPSVLATADIGIAPYRSDEARYLSPMKVFEYLATGLAAAATDLPGVTDHFRDDAVVLFGPGSASGLANAVSLLTGDRLLRRRLHAHGPDLIAGGHTWGHRARRVLQVLHDLRVAPELVR
jgi:glycosyltransferase involved in cell wall biosynthesis